MLPSPRTRIPSPTFLSDGSHLLSPRPVAFNEPPVYQTGLHSQPQLHTPHTATLAEADYDVDIDSGFLPPQAPLCRLEGAPWNIWEDAWDLTSGFRPGIGERGDDRIRCWRQYIRDGMPVISVKPLQEHGVIELRRAHAVLTFLAHTYVHSQARSIALQPDYQPMVPRALAIPLCEVSQILNIPPILTYADTVLYNWKLKNPKLGFTLDNVEIPSTFTRTASEAHFFKTSLLIEAIGPICLGLMRSSLDEAFMGDELSIRRISDHLSGLVVAIQRMTSVLTDVRTACDPITFYWEIRPWLNGGRWVMEGVPAEPGPWQVNDFGGPSAGQSTLIHSIDVFLGVDHAPRSGEVSNEDQFMNRMSIYMPHHHRLFLRTLATNSQQIRSLVLSAGPKSVIAERYNNAISALKDLRNAHGRIALLYIVSQSRVEPPAGSAFLREWEEKMVAEWNKQQLALTQPHSNGVHTGTGGTDLAKFLKRCRERTTEALI
ncbi:hypothetical protein CROQUDRAFT_671939 [Cronartium quercuum f. sp. fusiforme G11]|uniref:Indoleamine 2,3-dioxygenase n=1 Tax=Cronartium quercuum f. sp. fusiforme G11 TaxID=708437 RepID=A0A9P6NFI4_9BASI|nr:hypothetical protein CROQUDRAFT_671939 [Cronartium quercuum f. sp. fusiforme G11]